MCHITSESIVLVIFSYPYRIDWIARSQSGYTELPGALAHIVKAMLESQRLKTFEKCNITMYGELFVPEPLLKPCSNPAQTLPKPLFESLLEPCLKPCPNPCPNPDWMEISRTEPDWQFPHRPFHMLNFPLITALLNRSTYHKSAKCSPLACLLIW